MIELGHEAGHTLSFNDSLHSTGFIAFFFRYLTRELHCDVARGNNSGYT